MKLHKIALSILLVVSTGASALAEEVKLVHLQMGGSYHQLFIRELMSKPTAEGEPVQATLLAAPSVGINPFHFSSHNWDFGNVFFKPGESSLSQVPIASASELRWFKRARENGQMPDLMIISGHHIPGIGWHSDSVWGEDQYYTRSLLLSSLLRLREENEDARAYFDNVKFVFISGCWGLVNMEPHQENGQLMSQDNILLKYEEGSESRDSVRGSSKNFYSLEGQRWELTTLYDGDFTKDKGKEICKSNKCPTYYINRVMSDDGLIDGEHRYNQPLNLRKLFPNAALIFGFHSPSPYNDKVKVLISRALERARSSSLLRESDQSYASNVIQSIISEETPVSTKRRLVQAFREAWTTLTWEQNKGSMPGYWGGRPGASITPAFPDLDNDGVFAWPKDYRNPSFAPRCLQYRLDAKPCHK